MISQDEFIAVAQKMLSGHDLPKQAKDYIDNAYTFLYRAGNLQFNIQDVAIMLSILGFKPEDYTPIQPPPKKQKVVKPLNWRYVKKGSKILTHQGHEGTFEGLEDKETALIKVKGKDKSLGLEFIILQ